MNQPPTNLANPWCRPVVLQVADPLFDFFPGYLLGKCVFLVWCQAPSNHSGANMLFNQVGFVTRMNLFVFFNSGYIPAVQEASRGDRPTGQSCAHLIYGEFRKIRLQQTKEMVNGPFFYFRPHSELLQSPSVNSISTIHKILTILRYFLDSN